MRQRAVFFSIVLFVGVVSSVLAEPPLKALIVDGQNNHQNWPETSQMMKVYLEQTGLFTAEFATSVPQGTDPDFQPDFGQYDVVVSNYNGAPWPVTTQERFVRFVREGGGFVVVHAANNAFGEWLEYNRMIGLGGWGGRTEKHGPYVFFTGKDKLVRDASVGPGGNHGPRHPFQVIVRNPNHPVTRGMPAYWMHSKDELYDRLRGPAENMEVLATAFSAKDMSGSGRHEPMIMSVQYGKGRVLHTPMGHAKISQQCVGFIVTLQRGAEWAATGRVTQKLPQDFPTADQVRVREADHE